jgi:hypothetical protein
MMGQRDDPARRLVALVVHGPGLGRRNPGLPSELFDVLVRALIKLGSDPGDNIDFASLPAETLDGHVRWRLKPLAVHRAVVRNNLRLA